MLEEQSNNIKQSNWDRVIGVGHASVQDINITGKKSHQTVLQGPWGISKLPQIHNPRFTTPQIHNTPDSQSHIYNPRFTTPQIHNTTDSQPHIYKPWMMFFVMAGHGTKLGGRTYQ